MRETPTPYYFARFHPFPWEGDVLFAGESQTKQYHAVGPQVLEYTLVHTVLSGNGFFACNGKRFELGPGTSFFIFPGALVSYASDGQTPWKYRWFAVHGETMVQKFGQLGIDPDRPVVYHEDKPAIPRLFGLMIEELQKGEPDAPHRAQSYLHLAIAEYARPAQHEKSPAASPESASDKAIEQAVKMFTLRYMRPISIGEVASGLGYHRTHFTKLFKAKHGVSPIEYLTNVRMERAAELLREPLTIQQVASSVGYVDALYFSKQFKLWCGKSPKTYRADLPR